MPYQLLPYIALIFSVAGVLYIIGRRLPEAYEQELQNSDSAAPVGGHLYKRLALEVPSKFLVWAKLKLNQLWHFILEAKDIKKTGVIGYRIKKILPAKRVKKLTLEEESPSVPRSEQYYLNKIKESPKDAENYNSLGKLYLDTKRFADARDMFNYLTKREPGNALYQARLGYSSFKLGLYSEAVSAYEQSLAIDSAQPNRYYNLALSLEALKNTDSAIIVLERAIELEPGNDKYKELLVTLKQKNKV